MLYIWLHPERTEANWEQLCERLDGLWHKAQTRFYESIRKYPPDFPLFGDFDFEKRLYSFFCARQGDYAPTTDRLYSALSSWVRDYFRREHHTVDDAYVLVPGSRRFVSYPNHIVRHGLDDYVDCCWELLSDENYVAKQREEYIRSDLNRLDNLLKFFIKNIANCHIALEVAEDNDPAYAEVAQTLLDLMAAKTWPDVAAHVFDAGCELAKEELNAGS